MGRLGAEFASATWKRDDCCNAMKATIALALILLLASPGLGSWPWPWHWGRSKSANDPPVAAAPADAPGPLAPGPAYVIGLGDVLRISVWKEPELTSTVQVRSDGKISLPLLNDVPAVGSKPTELAASLAAQLSKYVDDPQVTVIVSQARPQIIYMVGEVGRRGPMPLIPNMTVLQALMTAGLSMFANTRKIYVLRIENGAEQKLHVNYKAMVKGKTLNQNILLKPGDMVVVP